jgi:DNA-directed RNA polymerase specialized sigma24 family protein
LSEGRARVVAWLGREILPHEAAVRAWLRRSFAAAGDVDDIIQETYCRLAALTNIEHIDQPRGYFFQAARSVALEQIRRARVVRISKMRRLGVSEHIVENEAVRGLRAILAAMTELVAPAGAKGVKEKTDGRTRKRR